MKAISGRRAPTSTPPARSSSHGGPYAGLHLPGVETALQLLGPAAPEERRPAALADLAVEEHRQPELRREPLPDQPRDPRGAPHVLGTQRHDRDDVRGADPRMRALVRARGRCAPSRTRRLRRARPRARLSSPTSVKTERLWSGSEWTSSRSACCESAAASASIVARSRPSLVERATAAIREELAHL